MDQNQQDLRRAANQAFMESLEQLQASLNQDNPASGKPSENGYSHAANNPSPGNSSTSFDLAQFEQAVADIDDFFKNGR
jgi:anthranilate/para-aminobenzoate synthase component I